MADHPSEASNKMFEIKKLISTTNIIKLSWWMMWLFARSCLIFTSIVDVFGAALGALS